MLDVDAVGIDTSAIPGEESEAVAIAMARFEGAIVQLPVDKRTIGVYDVLYDGDMDNAATDSWYDWFTPAMLSRGEGGTQTLAAFLKPDAGLL